MRLFLSLLLVSLILPQTSSDNVVVSRFNDTGFFAGYSESKSAVSVLTWLLLFVVMFLHMFFLHAFAKQKHVKKNMFINPHTN
jgi:preprotein translocase subunit SecG